MRKIAIIIYAPPGGGKGTQAELLAKELGLIHFDTGKFLEAAVHDPERRNEVAIKKERKNFDTGILMMPSFVYREVARAVTRIARSGWGVVFSGSPRTMYEAERLIPLLEKLYSKENIHVVELKVPIKDAVNRNSKRVLCSICRAPLLTAYYPSKQYKHCPVCAGPFYKRTLDNPNVMKVRIVEYDTRTRPIFDYLTERKYKRFSLSGVPAPYLVFKKVLKEISDASR